MNCPKCQSPIQPNARFCGTCGQVIEAAAPAIEPPAASATWSAASAALPGLLQRIKNIVLSPKTEWPLIATEPTSIAELYSRYVMPLAAFAALMSLVRLSLIGVNVPFGGTVRTPIAGGLLYAVLTFGFGLLFLFLVGLIINGLAPTFSGVRDQRQALKVAAYSFTPAWLSTLLGLSPILATLLQFLAGLYGIYVLYLGLPVLMRSPREKAFGYTAAVVVCTILLGILLGVVGAAFGYFGHTRALVGANPTDQAAAQDRGAAAVGNIIGGALGTDEKGKAGLTAALSNLVKVGEQNGQPSAQASANPAATSADAATPSNSAAASNAADNAQNPLSAAGGLVTALGGALGGNHRVDVVDFKTLTAMLPPSLPGMKRTEAQGENQGAIGVRTSSAHGSYQSDNGSSVHIEISDMSGVSGLMDMAGALVQNTTSQSDSGFERDQNIGGRSVHEKFDTKAKKGEASVMLAKRFQVVVSGEGIDMQTLEQALGQVDLARLEAMKDQGSQPK